jgi:hypothetical protein
MINLTEKVEGFFGSVRRGLRDIHRKFRSLRSVSFFIYLEGSFYDGCFSIY